MHGPVVRFLECSASVGLPLSVVQLHEAFWRGQDLLAATIEDVDCVVNFDSFVQHTRHKEASIWGPFDADCAI